MVLPGCLNVQSAVVVVAVHWSMKFLVERCKEYDKRWPEFMTYEDMIYNHLHVKLAKNRTRTSSLKSSRRITETWGWGACDETSPSFHPPSSSVITFMIIIIIITFMFINNIISMIIIIVIITWGKLTGGLHWEMSGMMVMPECPPITWQLKWATSSPWKQFKPRW